MTLAQTVATTAAARVSAIRPAEPVRVMVVDDSPMIRRVLTSWLNELSDVRVVAAHANGRLAVDDVVRARPDVVILDIEMPEMDGLTALPLLLARRPGVMVLLASTLSRRGAEVTIKGLTLGAADYLTKPEGTAGLTTDQYRAELVAKVRQLGRRKPLRQRAQPVPSLQGDGRPDAGGVAAAGEPGMRLRPYSMSVVRCLVIGSSTGGPQALGKVLTDIGPPLARVPVLITQHMPPTFTAILADHLGKATGIPTAEARDGEPVRAGRILVAQGGLHLLVARSGEGIVARLSDAPPENFCKPAVDPLFRSAAEAFGAGTLAVVLTGMGTDGAKGSMAVADAGGSVIAQDAETSVVWGMPGATAAAGTCSGILPVGEIGPRIARMLTGVRS